MSDEVFLQGFLDGSLSPEQFHHRDHLRLSWLLIRQSGIDGAGAQISAGIRAFAAHHGHPEKYHETMTQFWIRVIGHMIGVHPEISDFESFVEAFPLLLDPRLSLRHWRAETIGNPAARAAWLEPDLLPLPA
ncbi:MAG TPA: hypothetical protein VN837_12245 [Chloroflexota bacterium]|nr:hypothetical protein [Chloroflexota bacterium]